ncbi:MAG: nicotinate-nucleotide adenylyltransferase [Bacteroidota bacterium]
MRMKRIGIFGGSFDPVHNVHLRIAREAVRQLYLDRIFFVPAFIPPHKRERRLTATLHRLNMLKRALSKNEKYSISKYEISRKGVSYTIETLRKFRKRFPTAELILIIGSDSLEQIPTWKDADKIIQMADLAVYERSGFPIDAAAYPHRRIQGKPSEVSSTAIREQAGTKKPFRSLVPESVWKYIKDKKLYVHSSMKI